MRYLILFTACFLNVLSASAQLTYPVAAIPKPLLSRAGAVVRNAETVIEVKDLDEVIYKRKFAITILNESAKEHANVVFEYDKTSSIKSVKGAIYNEIGLPIGKFSEKNMQDRSAVNDFSLYEDNRMKYFIPVISAYPFTIEYEVEYRNKQSLSFPTWQASTAHGVATEHSSMTFICPSWFNLRYKEFNYPGRVEETSTSAGKTYKWAAKNLPALREEPYSPHPRKVFTSVSLAPEKFAYRGTKGSFTNWTEYGKWMYENLLKGRDELPETTKSVILDLVKDIKDPKEKARKIYE
ncbi:DUF3857 domain-containing protein [Pedobacter sp. SYSU D00535]|uniref:DUF3857 domain-containing protein n=1 Tax=Pedobacter sp. SYSU D00535 TaxID=2810308 RepID=UPI001F625436|nr:DUF3857 domain-containing protein [Pedobacter sp. SYSU D00535]